MKYKPSRDLPKFAIEYRTVSPTELSNIILQHRNKAVTPQAISMWFRDHPDIKEHLLKEIQKEELPDLEVSETIFQNGTFEELSSVKKWIQEMQDRELAKTEIRNRISALKRVCRDYGIEDPTFKHPDRLTLKQARDYIRTRREQGLSQNKVRISLRDFLLSKGMVVGKKISGSSGRGKYRKLYIPPEIVREFLSLVRHFNHEIYTIDLFEVKTGTRINAILGSKIENLNADMTTIEVFDKGRRSMYPKGHPWDKHIDLELRQALQKVIAERVSGLIFSVKPDEIRNINRAVLEDLIKKYRQDRQLIHLLKMALKLPTHWLRHEFFQHCLHESGWEYGVCAALGGSTVSSLEESYGAPPEAIVKNWGKEWLEKISV